MFHFKILSLSVIFVYATISNAEFPTDPKPCPYGDGECIKKIINFLFSEQVNGYAPLNLVNLNPLKVAEISIKQGMESPINIDLRFRNSEMTGIKNAKALKVTGFGKDLTQPHKLLLAADFVTWLSDYTVKGKVLVLPVSGSGKCNVTMDNIKLNLTIHGEPIVKNGLTYMNVKDLNLKLGLTRMHFDFSNLFNGNKVLGDNANLFLNENWKDVYDEVRGSMTTALVSIFKSVINNVFQKYPYDQFFASE